MALVTNAHLQLIQGVPRTAVGTATECLELARRFGTTRYVPRALRVIGLGRLYLGEPDAMRYLEEAVARATELAEDAMAVALATLALSVGALFQGDPDRALRLLSDVQATCRAHGDQWWLGGALSAAVIAAIRLGDLAAADRYARESLRLRRATHDLYTSGSSVELLAWTASAAGHHQRAARL